MSSCRSARPAATAHHAAAAPAPRIRPLLALATLLLTTTAHAQGWVEIERPPITRDRPALGAVRRVSSDVRVTLDGRVARVAVEERFRNDGSRVAEGSYLYPMPGEAVFQDFSLWQGDQELKGEMLNAEQARAIYEAIVRQQRDPALLTLAGHGLVRAQVFPIQPGETRRVVIRYTVQLSRAGDALRFRYAAGLRGGTDAAGTGPTPTTLQLRLPDDGTVGEPFSPTHRLRLTRDGRQRVVTVEGGADHDAELLLPLRQGLVGASVLSHAVPGDDGTFMLLLSPPAERDSRPLPRALTIVVDVSGSMSGAKMEQARAALLQSIDNLGDADVFRLVAFSSGVREFREGWTPASTSARADARAFITALQADGGTNIEGALRAAFNTRATEGRLPLVLFITDGQPSVGEQAPERLAAMAAGGARVFPVGVGHDVNTYLIERLAAEGRGAPEFVAPDANVGDAIGGLLAKLQRPAMTNLRIVSAPVPLQDLEPAQLPDLFAGEELVVFGRYRGAGEGDVVLEGERLGRRERFSARAVFVRNDASQDYLPRLWANRRAGTLTRAIRLDGASPERLNALRDLALRYGVLTEYTSYLVQEPTPVALNEGRPGEPRPVPMPAMAAPPPSAQNGAMAVERATDAAAMRKSVSLSEVTATADVADRRLRREGAGASATTSGRAPATERRQGRVFVQRDGVWTDLAHVAGRPVVRVAAYSDAYFALLRALPELGALMGREGDVLVAGRGQSVRIGREGTARWAPGELAAVVRSFRGA